MENNLTKEMIDALINTLKSDNTFYEALIEEGKRRGLENHPVFPSSETVQNTKKNIDLLIEYLAVLKERLDNM